MPRTAYKLKDVEGYAVEENRDKKKKKALLTIKAGGRYCEKYRFQPDPITIKENIFEPRRMNEASFESSIEGNKENLINVLESLPKR